MKNIIDKFRSSIQVKIISLIIFSLLLTIISILIVTITTQKESLLSSADNTLATNTEMLSRSIQVIMLNGEAPLAVRTVESLQSIPDLEKIELYRRDGSVAFHDYETLEDVNRRLGEQRFVQTMRLPFMNIKNENFEKVVLRKTPVKIHDPEKKTMEFYFPMLNTPECRTCHGDDHFVRGVERVEIDVMDVYAQLASSGTILTVIFLVAGSVIAAILIFSLRRMVISPLKAIGVIVENVTEGDLDVRLNNGWKDEFGIIERNTNEMIESLKRRTKEILTTQDVTILSLASLAETRDNETGNHIIRTGRYIQALAEQLRTRDEYSEMLTDNTIRIMHKSAPLHDIGKVGIPDAILLKEGPLTDEEWVEMRKHPCYGHDALKVAEEGLGTSHFLSIARELIISHHEKWDGSGYPGGLKGDEIPLSGRLMALADVYDALISERPYKRAFSHEETKKIILESRGSHFDPMVVDAFLESEQLFIDIAQELKD